VLTTDTNAADTLLRASAWTKPSYFGGGLVAVTGGDSLLDGGQVWMIASQTNTTSIFSILDRPQAYLEGASL
jgi:hypothetical protein